MRQPAPCRPTVSSNIPPGTSQQDELEARDFAEFIEGQDPLDAAAAEWWVRRQDGLTSEEECELADWLDADPAHGKALEQIDGVWGKMDELPEQGVALLKAGLPAAVVVMSAASDIGAASSRPQVDARHGRRSAQPTSPGRRAWLLNLGRLMPQAATAAVAFSAVGGGWYGWSVWRAQPTFEQSFATVRGQQKKVQLPDGSTLWLDTATKAEVTLFRDQREVRLSEGQAFFSVQANPDQPFHVLAGATRITVVGTRFSVRHTHSGLGVQGSVSIAVEDGRVRVSGPSVANEVTGTSPFVELVAGDSVFADAAGELSVVTHATPQTATWREGRVNFNGTPLEQALAEFERYGDTGLAIRDPAVGRMRVNGSFDVRQVSSFARSLTQVLPVRLITRDGHKEIAAVTGS